MKCSSLRVSHSSENKPLRSSDTAREELCVWGGGGGFCRSCDAQLRVLHTSDCLQLAGTLSQSSARKQKNKTVSVAGTSRARIVTTAEIAALCKSHQDRRCWEASTAQTRP